MNNIIDLAIETILKNKISSTEVADALNKTGVLEDLKIFNPGHFIVGKVSYVYTFHESNWALHEQVANLPEDTILFVDAFDCKNRAIFGDIVSKYLILYKKVKGFVVNGTLRDAHRLRKENYPIWCTGVTPLGCFNKNVTLSSEGEKYISERKEMFQNSIMVCDDSGCTLIENQKINEELLKRLEFIELQEDIWYFCIDTLKMSTYDTICLKRYLDEKELLPENLRCKLNEFENKIK